MCIRDRSNDPVDFLGHINRGNSPAHGFNRYAYANNNPYKFIDPDGRVIKPVSTASSAKQRRQEVREIKSAVKALKRSNPQTKALVQGLEKSNNVHAIIKTKPNEAPGNASINSANESNGEGTGTVTAVDVTKSYSQTQSDGSSIELSGESALAHELQHAADKDSGTFDRTEVNGTSVGEQRGVDAGNTYRESVGEELRDSY